MPRYSKFFASSALVFLTTTNVAVYAQDAFDELDAATGGGGSFQSAADKAKKERAEFEAFKRAQQNEYAEYKRKLMEEFAEFKKIHQEEAEKYNKALEKYWDTPETSSKKVWVDYSKDLKNKSRVDFENRTIALSSALDKKAAVSDKQLREELKSLVTKTKAQAFEEDVVSQAVEKRSKEKITTLKTDKVAPTPILTPYLTGKEKVSDKEVDQIVDYMMKNKKLSETVNKKGQKIVTVEVPLAAPEQMVEAAQRKTKTSANSATTKQTEKPAVASTAKSPQDSTAKTTSTTATRSKTTAMPTPVEMPKPVKMPKPVSSSQIAKAEPRPSAVSGSVPSSLPTPAKTYAPSVYKNAEKTKMDDALVWAIIETESSFNPMAKSGIPAYGLMQIVPNSAGQDATEQLFGKAKILSPSYLYNSDNNIEIGSTYLNILYYRYLKGIKNPVSRMYCAIAAYNTGAGNVAKAFTGKRRISPALEKINKMSPQQVYNHLVSNLPYEETRRYVQKVNKRMPKYRI